MCSICVPELTVAKDAVAAPNAATRVRQCHLSLYRPRAGGPDLHEISAPTRCRRRPHMPRGVCKAHSDGSRQGGRRRLVSPGSGRVCGPILAGLPLDAARVPARPYRAPGWARRCPPARGGHALDDSVSMARGCRAEPSVPSRSSACDAAGIGGIDVWPEVARRMVAPGQWRLQPVRRTTILATRRPAGPCGGRTPPHTPPCRWHCRAA